ncbi:hypothetical protein LCGC14_1192960 [marine sediment metagenome]|uniref:Type-4 uracil-DNA glycosylase n=1 Tax=marine sediment metagenome TaxID=412755 RepID=A0A0F9P1K3_9ZZZZ
MDWKELESAVAVCENCGLCETRTNTVFGTGDQKADWLFVGEAPGYNEDKQGEPFVGRAGNKLNQWLEKVGLSRESVYIANTLKCRPPNNRDPLPDEALNCRPYLRRQIELLQPKIIIPVGRIAAQLLLRTDTPIGQLRKQCHFYEKTDIPVVVTYHPAYILRNPAKESEVISDLLFAHKILGLTEQVEQETQEPTADLLEW